MLSRRFIRSVVRYSLQADRRMILLSKEKIFNQNRKMFLIARRRFSSESSPNLKPKTNEKGTDNNSWPTYIAKLPKELIRKTFYLLKLVITNPAIIREKWSSLKKFLWEECLHYWNGSKLLYYNINATKNLMLGVLEGHQLSRRERKLLTRTVSDVFRVVPFSVFVLIPFMEIALPFFLKLFPNMLPSTFKSKKMEQEDMKRSLQLRLDLAKFLQDTVEEMAKKVKLKAEIGSELNVSAEELLELIQRTKHGQVLTTNDTLKLIKVFRDEITLENISRAQLVNICRYMHLTPYGGDAFLRFQIRNKIRSIKTDDQMIQWEGVDALTKDELQSACAERGMRSVGLTQFGLQQQLKQWLDLSVNRNVPLTLLILSRAMTISHSIETLEKNLVESISTLDSGVVKEAVLAATSTSSSKLKLESLNFQTQMIQDEKKDQQEKKSREEVSMPTTKDSIPEKPKAKITTPLVEALEMLASKSAVSSEREKLDLLKAKQDDINLSVTRVIKSNALKEPSIENEKKVPIDSINVEIKKVDNESNNVNKEDVVIPKTASASTFRDKLINLRKSLRRAEDLKPAEVIQVVVKTKNIEDSSLSLDSTAMQVKGRVDKMLLRIQSEIDVVDKLMGDKMKQLDKDEDGVVSQAELAKVIREMLKGNDELGEAEAIASLLDSNQDGMISVEEIIALADELELKAKKEIDEV